MTFAIPTLVMLSLAPAVQLPQLKPADQMNIVPIATVTGQGPVTPVEPVVLTERRGVPTRNVKVDVTISDQTGSRTPMKKVVSLLVADGRSGGVRSQTNVPVSTGGPNRDLPLNVDATANVTAEGRILLELRFNYSSISTMTPLGAGDWPEPANDEERARNRDVKIPRASQANITENLVVLLVAGAPTVVARSADPVTDRTVTVEVKAEIAK